jgi:hypothetical protein
MTNVELVNLLAGNSHYSQLSALAAKIVEKVTKTNATNLVSGGAISAAIEEMCGEFRGELKRAGFEMPDSDEVLYNEIIRPLVFLKTDRAA